MVQPGDLMPTGGVGAARVQPRIREPRRLLAPKQFERSAAPTVCANIDVLPGRMIYANTHVR
jgi:hypothetical protein